MTPQEADTLAAQLAMIITSLDVTMPAATPETLLVWSQVLEPEDFTLQELTKAAGQVYGHGGEVPKNKLGAVLGAAREIRAEDAKARRRAAREARELEAGKQAVEPAGWAGAPVPGAYAAHGARTLRCRSCGARPGDPCRDKRGRTLRMPHLARLADGRRCSA